LRRIIDFGDLVVGDAGEDVSGPGVEIDGVQFGYFDQGAGEGRSLAVLHTDLSDSFARLSVSAPSGMPLFSYAEKLVLLLIMDTAFLLMAMYSGRPIIPAQDVARDFFGLSTEKFVRKVSAGDIALPLVRMEASQKCAKGVHIDDLAEYLDRRRAAAVKECELLQGSGRL
jgi:hypothetical protein